MRSEVVRLEHNEELPGRNTSTLYQPESVEEATKFLSELLLRASGPAGMRDMQVSIAVTIARTGIPGVIAQVFEGKTV